MVKKTSPKHLLKVLIILYILIAIQLLFGYLLWNNASLENIKIYSLISWIISFILLALMVFTLSQKYDKRFKLLAGYIVILSFWWSGLFLRIEDTKKNVINKINSESTALFILTVLLFIVPYAYIQRGRFW